ncbi:MAG: family 1 glycosylhydrolase [Anaerolineales bacterium]|nr:family 1 glycosylhydrolase [Anaerolineales bacterium]
MKKFEFPSDFLWGSATAGHQVEGNNSNSDVWALEHLPHTPFAEPSGEACDHFNRYPQDIALLADLGFNSYRFSLEWARIEPEEGVFSLEALDHYRRVLATCHEHNLKPMVTFHHFTSPQWIHRDGGWLSEKTPDRFARFCEKTAVHLGDLISAACTFNEPNISQILKVIVPFNITAGPWWPAAAAAFGTTPDNLGLFQFVTQPRLWETVLQAHRQAREVLRSGPGDYPVGLTLALHDFQAAEGGEEKMRQIRRRLADNFLEQLEGDDFVGVQTYARLVIGPEGIIYPGPEVINKNQLGEEIYPRAIGGAIRLAAEVSGLPVYVTENGLSTEDDTQRVAYFQGALPSVAECIEDGIDVRGYYAWSTFDNFEWVAGYGPKFGIIAVDRETQVRTPKPSAHWLGEVAQENCVSMPEERPLLEKYLIPQLPTSLPAEKKPYLLRDREGDRYLLGTQLITFIATSASSGGLFELVSISGNQGDGFPAHRHAQAHEGIYVQNGLVELLLGEESYLLAPGDYANIPAGTPHAYTLRSHDARLLSVTSKGVVGSVYTQIGTATDLHVHPPQGKTADLAALLTNLDTDVDLELVDAMTTSDVRVVTNVEVPDGIVPYVIASGGGIHRIAGKDLFILLATNANTGGDFIVLDNVGTVNHAIVQHYHEKHTETFLCTAGQMSMWANDLKYQMYPGDFLHVPAGTKHSFRFEAHYTRFFSVLATGLFEDFFHTLGSPYKDGFIFPPEPGPVRFDRLAQKVFAGELDLKIVGPAPDGA